MINEVNREQVELLRRFRGASTEAERERYKAPLLLFHQLPLPPALGPRANL